MILAVAIISIVLIAAFSWAAGRVLGVKLCPICAGVAGTWMWLLAAKGLGYAVDPLVPAILMGGSVVGIAYAAERRLAPPRSALLWKMLFIPAGFVAAYGILLESWVLALAALLAALGLSLFFLRPPSGTGDIAGSAAVKKLERDMKNCC